MRINLIFILGIALVFWWSDVRTDAAIPVDTIRVAIVKNSAAVTVDGEGLLATRENGQAVPLSAPVTVKQGRDALILVDGVACRRLTLAASGAVIVNGKPYRGMAEISPGDRGLLVVNELPLEDYLIGLINCEISSAWPIEAVKAQAVIARTYALNRRQARASALYHLESSVMDQVYDGCQIEDSRARRAVTETAGQVLSYNGALIQAFYHSSCGGRTEAAENVWGTALPYLKGVECQYCLNSPAAFWEQKLSLRELEERLRAAGVKLSGLTGIRPGALNRSGRMTRVVLVTTRGEQSLTGDQFRKFIGYGVIRSTNFTVATSNGELIFSGAGNGHGVGLCQWGAKQRALDGFSYQEILSYYYPGTELRQFFDIR